MGLKKFFKKVKKNKISLLKINQNNKSKICYEEKENGLFIDNEEKKIEEEENKELNELKDTSDVTSLNVFLWPSDKNDDSVSYDEVKINHKIGLRRPYSSMSLKHIVFYNFNKLDDQVSFMTFQDHYKTVSDQKTDNILTDVTEGGDSSPFHSFTTINKSITKNDIRSKYKKIQQLTKYPGHASNILGQQEKPFFQKWNLLKSGIKLKGFKKKDKKNNHKQVKLISQLEAGAPAAIIFASFFQRDDNGRRKIPILIDQLKINVLDAKNTKSRSHTLFQIKLKYGDGKDAVEWSVYREWKDFFHLHTRYRVSETVNGQFRKVHGLPRFPKSSVPYLRSIRGFASGDSDYYGEKIDTSSKQNIFSETESMKFPIDGKTNLIKSLSFVEMQRKRLDEYIKNMVQLFLFRPEGIRLCLFLELSALGIKLGKYEKYHGKEGLLSIVNSKGSTRKITCNLIEMRNRSLPKWYLVRESYIVCVNDLSSTNIYDVFLMDDGFEIARKYFSKETPVCTSKTKKDNLNKYQPKRHTFKIKNYERRIKLLAKNEITVHQFMESIKATSDATIWTKLKRFDSFSPVRTNAAAQWIVDGRDYFWNVSKAISNAKETIYIHDWWLSPELYLRRPACISQDWRLDRLLKKKANEGVQIYIIIYHNVGTTVPVDSTYTKYRLLSLSPNIYVQRSPSHLRQNTFFWAHHEKIVCIDGKIGFIGGIDLCFGRWDSYEHVLYDDKPSGWDEMHNPISDIPEEPLIWPGKDYSNPRVQDFFTLDKPYEDMYNRTLVPRMAWHDISVQVVGQPARDIARHFVQRWNYHLRNKTPSRPTPFLVPPPDYTQEQLEENQFIGSNELQILRSAGPWSIGTLTKVEHSILNAYVECIETSEHFVYIENQFFITSSECEGAIIENHIGDALVKRIIRAHKNNEKWRTIIILPLVPGFQNDIDVQEGTSLRLIMHCQYRSICRCKCSIFKKLEAVGIDPLKYIRIYSLRNWAKIGENGRLVSEMVYVHAKCMIVDDRVCIIGSANINERSMRGNRDSEIAAIIRDTDMQLSTMAGKSYMVGKFSYTLRVRLMREHLGINCDKMEKLEYFMDGLSKHCKWKDKKTQNLDNFPTTKIINNEEKLINKDFSESYDEYSFSLKEKSNHNNLDKSENLYQIKSNMFQFKQKISEISGLPETSFGRRKVTTEPTQLFFGLEVQEISSSFNNPDINSNIEYAQQSSYKESTIRLEKINSCESNITSNVDDFNKINPSINSLNNLSEKKSESKTSSTDLQQKIEIDPMVFLDPLADHFFEDIWDKIAQKNTEIYRQVFRCMPDNEVRTWKEYYRYKRYAERFMQRYESEKINSIHEFSEELPGSYRETLSYSDIDELDNSIGKNSFSLSNSNLSVSRETYETNITNPRLSSNLSQKKSSKNSDDIFLEPQELLEEKLLNIQGHLVVWPTEWLAEEYEHGHWLFAFDRIPPIDIYT